MNETKKDDMIDELVEEDKTRPGYDVDMNTVLNADGQKQMSTGAFTTTTTTGDMYTFTDSGTTGGRVYPVPGGSRLFRSMLLQQPTAAAGMNAHSMQYKDPETSTHDLVYRVLQAQGILLKEIEEMRAELTELKNEHSNYRSDGQRENDLQ